MTSSVSALSIRSTRPTSTTSAWPVHAVYQQAGGLLLADGKVISNRTCEQSRRENCFIAANDAKTGRLVWKFFTTAAPGDLGGDTWGNVPVEQRAAGPWGQVGSYDPKRKVL